MGLYTVFYATQGLTMKQLELFPEIFDEKKEIEEIRNEWHKVRKALFMELSFCKKQYQELAHEHMILKLNICKGRLTI